MLVLITREECERCKTVKKIFDEFSIGYIEFKIGVNITRETVMDQYPGRISLPIVVDNHNELGVLSQSHKDLLEQFIWRWPS